MSMYECDDETVSFMLERFDADHGKWVDGEGWVYDENDVEKEIEEIKGAISNERLWAKGADDPSIHEQNIANLEQYLVFIEKYRNKDDAVPER